MKKVYKSPSIKLICGVCDSVICGSNDIETYDNNYKNGGGTITGTPGINYGKGENEYWTGGDLNEGDLE